MKTVPLRAALLCLAAGAFLITAAAVRAEEEAAWATASEKPGLTIFQRLRKDSALYEFKAIGEIAAPPEVVKRVLDDVLEYPHFMPYVAETRIISQDAHSRVSYQRISPPLVGERDYTVRVKFETRHTAEGNCYCNRWQAANELGPTENKGVVRVKVTEGYWLLEPTEGGQKTRATYAIFSDSGGSIPTAFLNTGSRTAIPKLFDSVRRQSLLPKYHAAP